MIVARNGDVQIAGDYEYLTPKINYTTVGFRI